MMTDSDNQRLCGRFTFRTTGGFLSIGFASAVLCLTLSMSTPARAGTPQPIAPGLHDEVVNFAPGGKNLLVNGSFELGLGAEPFSPGWRAKGHYDMPRVYPPLPVIDDKVSHTGSRSLMFDMPQGTNTALLYMKPPNNLDRKKTYYLSFWIKSNIQGLHAIDVSSSGNRRLWCRKTSSENGWDLFAGSFPKTKSGTELARTFRIAVTDAKNKPFKFWIDDICWSEGKAAHCETSGPVEAVLKHKQGPDIRFAEEPVILQWAAQSDRDRKVKLELHLRDLTRDGIGIVRREGTVSLGKTPTQKSINMGKLKRGHYMALLGVRDAASGRLLAVGRELFSVMTNLRKLPTPVDMVSGTMFGLQGSGWGGYEYNWRGFWTSPEYYDMAYQFGLRMERVFVRWNILEPERGKYNWYFEPHIKIAKSKGCQTMLVFPQWPDRKNIKAYNKIINTPGNGEGRWLWKEGKLLRKGARRGVVVDLIEIDDTVTEVIIMPPADALIETSRKVAERYAKDLALVEYRNECNLIVPMKEFLEYIAKPVYPVFKKVAPDLPMILCANRTIDAPMEFFGLGGWQYADGYSYHPYGAPNVKLNGIKTMREYESVIEAFKDKKKLRLGQSELLLQHERGKLRGWETSQRVLLDWSGKCNWSTGPFIKGFCAIGAEFDQWSGPHVPAYGAVAMNGMHRVLAGAQSLGRAAPDPDDMVLVALFKSKYPVETTYTAAITAAHLYGRVALMQLDLSGLPCKAFDQWGELIDLPKAPLALSKDVLYLQSRDKRLIDRMKQAKVKWHSSVISRTDDDFPNSGQGGAYQYKTGMIRKEDIGYQDIWKVISTQDSSMGAPQATAALRRDGAKVLKADKLHNVSFAAKQTRHRGRKGKQPPALPETSVSYALAEPFHPASETIDFYWTEMGIKSMELWVNGESVYKRRNSNKGIFGENWHRIRTNVKAGFNSILVRIVKDKPNAAFRLCAGDSPKTPLPIDRTDAPGMLLKIGTGRRQRVVGALVDNQFQGTNWRQVTKPGGVVTFSLSFIDGLSHRINGYELYPGYVPNDAPKKWVLKASNDAQKWVTLDKRELRYHWLAWHEAFKFDNNTPYRYYQFEFEAAGNMLRMGEIEMFDFGPGT
jgi:hypothetical protein